jgi:outer membrane protein assembly factor BamA
MILGSLEYEIPLVKDLLSIAVFADTGSVAQTLGDADAFDMRLTVGGGIRIAIPMLLGPRPLALDFGAAVISKQEDEQQIVSFTLGRSF